MIGREACEAAFREAVAWCNPEKRVRGALERLPLHGANVFGIAIGKAALAMARGAGPVARGVIVTNADDGRGVPAGWHTMVAAHPVPDERSLAAGDAVIDLIASASATDEVLVLMSGGASALVERPLPGISFDQLRTDIAAVMASGAPIHELNRARIARSAIKGGKLAAMSLAPITTLVVSDVFDDDPAIIGSGPTVPRRPQDRLLVVAAMHGFADTVHDVLAERGNLVEIVGPLTGDVTRVANELVYRAGGLRLHDGSVNMVLVAWGEPTIAVPRDHGDGGRAQQLALELARAFAGRAYDVLAIGSDGCDGPPPSNRPTPAGAFVDGRTWDAILAAGLDPQRALDRCDAGTALAAVGALVITGPTGINHGDLVIVG